MKSFKDFVGVNQLTEAVKPKAFISRIKGRQDEVTKMLNTYIKKIDKKYPGNDAQMSSVDIKAFGQAEREIRGILSDLIKGS